MIDVSEDVRRWKSRCFDGRLTKFGYYHYPRRGTNHRERNLIIGFNLHLTKKSEWWRRYEDYLPTRSKMHRPEIQMGKIMWIERIRIWCRNTSSVISVLFCYKYWRWTAAVFLHLLESPNHRRKRDRRLHYDILRCHLAPLFHTTTNPSRMCVWVRGRDWQIDLFLCESSWQRIHSERTVLLSACNRRRWKNTMIAPCSHSIWPWRPRQEILLIQERSRYRSLLENLKHCVNCGWRSMGGCRGNRFDSSNGHNGERARAFLN